MNQMKSPSAIARFFQNEIEQKTESGGTPVLEIGVADIPTEAAATLTSLYRWHLQGVGVEPAVLPAGGLGPTWVAALMHPLPKETPISASNPIILYSGANGADYLASAFLAYISVEHMEPTPRKPQVIPATHFVPNSQPGMQVSWNALPFALTSVQKQSSVNHEEDEYFDNILREQASVSDWMAWAALLLALSLIVLAAIL